MTGLLSTTFVGAFSFWIALHVIGLYPPVGTLRWTRNARTFWLVTMIVAPGVVGAQAYLGYFDSISSLLLSEQAEVALAGHADLTKLADEREDLAWAMQRFLKSVAVVLWIGAPVGVLVFFKRCREVERSASWMQSDVAALILFLVAIAICYAFGVRFLPGRPLLFREGPSTLGLVSEAAPALVALVLAAVLDTVLVFTPKNFRRWGSALSTFVESLYFPLGVSAIAQAYRYTWEYVHVLPARPQSAAFGLALATLLVASYATWSASAIRLVAEIKATPEANRN